MIKKLFPIALSILLLTGCWDKEELNDRAIILATGIDKDINTEEIILTTQVVRPQTLQQNKPSSKSTIELVTGRGRTLFDAKQSITKQFDRKPYFAHSKIIIISERLAKSDLRPILDRLTRSNEIRPLSWLIIAKDASPQEIMSIERGISEIQAVYLRDIIKWRKEHSEANITYLQQFVEDMLGDGINPTTGAMEIVKDSSNASSNNGNSNIKKIKLTGTAVFKEDKLVGYLDDKETRGLNWITDKMKYGTIVVPSPSEKGKVMAIRIKKTTSKIEPEKKDGEFIFNIEINEKGELIEQQDVTDTSKPGVLMLIEKQQEEVIKKEIKKTIDKLQNDLEVDILGFGSTLNRKYPKEWKEIKDDWENIFPRVKYTVKVNTRIERTGLLLEPIDSKE